MLPLPPFNCGSDTVVFYVNFLAALDRAIRMLFAVQKLSYFSRHIGPIPTA
jgi:hypothetical protein